MRVFALLFALFASAQGFSPILLASPSSGMITSSFTPSCRLSDLPAPSLRLQAPQLKSRVPKLSLRMQGDDVHESRRKAIFGLIAYPSAAMLVASPKESSAAISTGGLVCDQAISKLVNKATNQEVYLIGTAHISEESAVLVRETIRQVKPDTIMVELDKSRVKRSVAAEESGETPQPPKSFWAILKSDFSKPGLSFADKFKTAEADLIGYAISSLYGKLNQMGFSSGKEFVTAIQEGIASNATIVLGDRPVNETLTRLQQAIDEAGWQKVANFAKLDMTEPEMAIDKALDGEGDADSIRSSVEALKERTKVRKIMSVLKDGLPEVYTALIGERDQYMATSIRKANGGRTVAVVGIAHMDGIEKFLDGFEIVPCQLASSR